MSVIMPYAKSFKGLVEFAQASLGAVQISHVLFDFDGTLSLIRQGWPEIMTPMFAEMLPPLPGETLTKPACSSAMMTSCGSTGSRPFTR